MTLLAPPPSAALRTAFGLPPAAPIFDAAVALARGQDLTRLRYRDRQFAFVDCRSVLERVADPVAVARELQRIGERGTITVTNGDGFWRCRQDGNCLQFTTAIDATTTTNVVFDWEDGFDVEIEGGERHTFAPDPTVSRFVRRSDASSEHCLYRLPATWWSRGREYAWALKFTGPEHRVLDAACGIEHPLKFLLADRCRHVVATDLDERLAAPDAILAAVAAAAPGDNDALGFAARQLPRLTLDRVGIDAMPYRDGSFDRVFCISVLEHLPPAVRTAALREFARVLAPGGLAVLTMDHPLVDLDAFAADADQAGLRFAGDVRRQLPADALWSPEYRLHCFRALLARDPASPTR
jgi:SAM-dependent methyltransferase